MRSGFSPRTVTTEHELHASALRALARRAHSINEMRRYLGRRAEGTAQVSIVIARLCKEHYLDDARYAVEYARHHATVRRQGRLRILRELRARGVSDGDIEAALASVFAETDETALVRARLRRRLAQSPGAFDQRKTRSLYRSLIRAGFSSDIIRSELRQSRAAIPDLSDSEGE